MTLPYREFTAFESKAIEGHDLTGGTGFTTINDWTITTYDDVILGRYNDGAAPKYWMWKGFLRALDLELISGADHIIDIGYDIEISEIENTAGYNSVTITVHYVDNFEPIEKWLTDSMNGKYYNGVNQWEFYPPGAHRSPNMNSEVVNFADMPVTDTWWTYAASAGGTKGPTHKYQEQLCINGLNFYFYLSDPAGWPGDGESAKVKIEVSKFKIHYFNPIVNSLSRQRFSGNGGEELILRGLAFNQDDAEIGDAARNSNNNPGVNWESIVDFIYFEGQEGQGTIELSRLAGDFIVDSDTQITIPSMPAMPDGSYKIRLLKKDMLPGTLEVFDCESYAGDFSADADGKMTKIENGSELLSIVVGEIPEKRPVFTWEWAWKIAGELVWKYYAPIDMRAADRFYEGRILSVASVTRSIDDFTGMFQVSDLDVELASNDSEFQKLLAQGYCKNQPVKLYFGWANEPVGWMQTYFQGIVDDYVLSGPTFKATLKDITQKYLRKKMPLYIITTEEWSNAHENAIGKAIPEVLGLHSLTTGENLGAIEAFCIDTTANKYIAAAHPLNSVLQVYADNVLVNPANYTVSNDAEGRTFITFTSSQGDKKITYNAEGYSLAAWNSSNGYVQNPAYVLGFFLVYLAEVPIDYIDTDSLDEVADLFEDNGWDECGKLALTELEDASSVLQKLLFSFGIKAWPDREGKLHFGRKDLTTFDTDKTIIAQTDCIEAPTIEFNLRDAVNRIKVCWDFYPAAGVYGGAREFESDASITDFESEIENYETWEYPCVSCEDFAVLRAGEDLQRLAYGNRVVSFTLPIDFIDELEIFDTFVLQDTFGLSPTGQGEEQHYYYVTSLTYDFQNMTIGVKASDLQWLVGQCFIIGRCDDLEHNYEDASQWMKVFGYVGSCATDTLPGGDPLKKICKCQ